VGAAFLDTARGAVVLMTCGKSLCDTTEKLVDIARKANARLKALSTSEEP
jgi:hypothetical protein